MSGHTPGPWFADIRLGSFFVYPKADKAKTLAAPPNSVITTQFGKGDRFNSDPNSFCVLTEEQIANAFLIAAAPNLLAACEKFCRAYLDINNKDPFFPMGNAYEDAREAAEMARGNIEPIPDEPEEDYCGGEADSRPDGGAA